jgi:protease secretion system outer membrane protein
VSARFAILFLLLSMSGICRADSLLEVWQGALRNSPDFRVAGFVMAGEMASADVAKSRLLPRIEASAGVFRNGTKRSLVDAPVPWSTFHYASERTALQFSFPILRPAEYLEWSRAKASATAAEEAFRAQEQLLAVEVSKRYLEAAMAREQLAMAERKVESLAQVVRVAQRSYAAGIASRTDVDDANAVHDAAVADRFEAEGAIAVTDQALLELTGTEMVEPKIHRMPTGRLPAPPGDGARLDDWLVLAAGNSPEIAGARATEAAAAFNRRRAIFDRFPTLDLVASKGQNKSDGESNIGYRYLTDAIGLQFSFPIYGGGGGKAALRRADAALGKASAELDGVKSGVSSEVTRQHSLMVAGEARVHALKTALDSANQSVISNEKGLQAGTRNIVDLINARQRQFDVQADLVRAQATYVVAMLRLKSLAGTLGADDMKRVSDWLQ